MIEIILGAIAATVFHFTWKELKDENDIANIICFITLAVCIVIALSIPTITVNELIKRLL